MTERTFSETYSTLKWMTRNFLASWLMSKAVKLAPSDQREVFENAFIMVCRDSMRKLNAL